MAPDARANHGTVSTESRLADPLPIAPHAIGISDGDGRHSMAAMLGTLHIAIARTLFANQGKQ